jgi:RNA polymerase sigma-70 factor (ECF subfamily)
LLRIRDATDVIAWQDFVSIYAPLIHAYARRRGLQDADAADASQVVLQSIARSISGFDYNPSKGKFRSWLFTIVRNQVSKSLQKISHQPVTVNNSSIPDQIDPLTDEEHWDREHERHLFHWAAEKVRAEFQDKTWQAFWLVAVEGEDVSKTAESLGMTSGATYIAKSRVTARLRQVIASVEDE